MKCLWCGHDVTQDGRTGYGAALWGCDDCGFGWCIENETGTFTIMNEKRLWSFFPEGVLLIASSKEIQ